MNQYSSHSSKNEKAKKEKKKLLSPKTRRILLILITATLVPIALAGWGSIYQRYLEKSPPVISELSSSPRGIGVVPFEQTYHLEDDGAGLSELIIHVTQRGNRQTLVRKKFNGEKEAQIRVTFGEKEQKLEEGPVKVEVISFDRSFWSNRGELSYSWIVDYHKPKIEVITTQHNATVGGAQLAFYRATDDNLLLSGVRVGAETYFGYPARLLDERLNDAEDLYMVLYSHQPRGDGQSSKITPKAFAEDVVGNARSSKFYYTVQSRTGRTRSLEITPQFLNTTGATFIKQYLPEVEEHQALIGEALELESPNSDSSEIDRAKTFVTVLEVMKRSSDNELQKLTSTSRSTRYWRGPFSQPKGVVTMLHGDEREYVFQDQALGRMTQLGYEFRTSPASQSIPAVNDGIVSFVHSLPYYGQAVGIDHGLGLVSVYTHLGSVSVRVGDLVRQGDTIGQAGNSGVFFQKQGFGLQLRLQGSPVDLREWWDKRWYYGHITSKILSTQKALGIGNVRGF